MRSRILSVLLIALIAASAYGIYSGRVAVPNEWNPWAPLNIDEPPNWLTSVKLLRVSADGALCMAVLRDANMRYEAVADRTMKNGCGFTDAVRVQRTSVIVSEPFTLSCRSAVSLALWERHFVQPAALQHFGVPVARMDHLGSYACRNIYGVKDGALSRHATADALDVAAFVLSDGRRIRIDRDWAKSEPDGAFLRDIRDGACRVFDSVLGPEYNEAHRNHFHLDRGGYRVCR